MPEIYHVYSFCSNRSCDEEFVTFNYRLVKSKVNYLTTFVRLFRRHFLSTIVNEHVHRIFINLSILPLTPLMLQCETHQPMNNFTSGQTGWQWRSSFCSYRKQRCRNWRRKWEIEKLLVKTKNISKPTVKVRCERTLRFSLSIILITVGQKTTLYRL